MKSLNKIFLVTGLLAGFAMPAAYADADEFGFSDRDQFEAEREYYKRQQEMERERLKYLQEIDRESRKHQAEMVRERRKHQREMQRERRKARREFEREFNRGYEEIVRRDQYYEQPTHHRHRERDDISEIFDILFRI